MFRALSGAHGSAIAAKSKEAVAQQLAQLLPMAEAVGPVCVPILPADVRDKYVKQVLVVQGLVALTSAVARNVTAMLPQVSGCASMNQVVLRYKSQRQRCVNKIQLAMAAGNLSPVA